MNNPSEKLIAVVGTMKAGKSTVINAIVGREVLPTRELPMTTIPTLVRHVPGQTEPVLEFSQKSTIEALLPQLATAISNPKNTSIIESSLCCSYNDQLIPSILDFVYRNKKLKKQYTGSVQILEFLRSLNDFTELCRYLDVDFPFEKFNHLQNLPTISVEFQSLKYLNNPAQVQLALLDTPGPNEYGQTHLKLMLKEQLQKASAVLAVLDYTQLNSDSNIDNNEIKKISEITGNRLYAIVNKFDNQNWNSQPKESIVDFVANTLMEGNIPTDHVFPVSSHNAYLANRALNALDLHQELPDHETEPWVKDFGLQAFGRCWKNNISDLVEAKYAANDLWHESLLQEPLNAIIQSLMEQSHHHKNQTPENKATVPFTPSRLSFLKSQSMPITIQDLQAEAIRLIDLEIKILEQMKEAPGVLIDNSQQKQTFNKESTKKRIEILEGERKKVQKLEAVIAVVGTMKAGKSTTINAIIGSEILPNRELAMTAIPTLIRHTIGQTEPILEFNHRTPIDNLLSKIIKFANDKKNTSTIDDLKKSPLTKESISWILNSTKSKDDYKSKYTGTNEIFSFLKKLNDLVRISKKIGIEFPFNEYKDIDKIPVINVEFFSLKEFNQTHGQLTLLDTPGPDEYGQEHLKPMLQDQLRKASAVLTVLDYTHLNSNSNVDVNNEIKEIASIAENRLYAILNKFDNKDANSQKPDDIINFVANDLIGEKIIPKNQIFAVSSKYAYLANRARHELKKNHKLPNHKDESWVEDFGNLALGQFWEEDINNIERVKQAANRIFEKSLFDGLLKNVIELSHKEAPRLAIASASSQIKSVSTDLGNFFSVMTGSLTKDIEELQKQASELDTQIKKIELTKTNISNHLEKTIRNLDDQISKKIEETRKELLSEIKILFAKGKDIEAEEYEKAIAILSKKKKQKSGLTDIVVKAVADLLNKDKEKVLFKPNASIIRIEDQQKAGELIKEISESISGKIQLSGVWLKNQVTLSIENLTNEFSDIVEKELKNTINNTEKSMSKGGFFIKLTPPEIEEDSLISIKIKISDVNINKKQETYTYEAWEGGWFNEILNKINSNWGYTTKTSTRDYFEIDINSIKNKIEKGIELIFSQVNTSVSQSIKQPLQESSEEYFQKLKGQIEKIQEDILQGMENKIKSEGYQSSLLSKLIEIQKPLLDLSTDSEELSKSIKEYNQ